MSRLQSQHRAWLTQHGDQGHAMSPAWVLPHGLQHGTCPSLLNMEQGLAVWFVWGLHGAHRAGEAAQRSGPACTGDSVVPSPSGCSWRGE